MNPTYIETAIYRPGVKLTHEEDDDIYLREDVTALVDVLGGRIYSVTRDKMIEEGEEAVDAEGRLTEILFVIRHMTEIRTCAGRDDHPWLVDYMANVGYEDLEEGNMLALYEVAVSLLSGEEAKRFVSLASFVGDWIIHTSQGYQDDYPEIDEIEFAGACDIELREEVP